MWMTIGPIMKPCSKSCMKNRSNIPTMHSVWMEECWGVIFVKLDTPIYNTIIIPIYLWKQVELHPWLVEKIMLWTLHKAFVVYWWNHVILTYRPCSKLLQQSNLPQGVVKSDDFILSAHLQYRNISRMLVSGWNNPPTLTQASSIDKLSLHMYRHAITAAHYLQEYWNIWQHYKFYNPTILTNEEWNAIDCEAGRGKKEPVMDITDVLRELEQKYPPTLTNQHCMLYIECKYIDNYTHLISCSDTYFALLWAMQKAKSRSFVRHWLEVRRIDSRTRTKHARHSASTCFRRHFNLIVDANEDNKSNEIMNHA